VFSTTALGPCANSLDQTRNVATSVIGTRDHFFVTLHTILQNPAAAQHFITTIKNRRLARSDRPLRLVEPDAHPFARQRRDGGRRRGVAIAQPYFSAHGFTWSLDWSPFIDRVRELVLE